MKTDYSKENLEAIVKNNTSIAGVMRDLGLKQGGGSRSTVFKYIEKYNINTDHFTGSRWNVGKKIPVTPLKNILKENTNFKSNVLLQRLVYKGLKEYKCECCGISNWNNKPITLELHHIDGNHYNNTFSNLQILCPNCHSQTDTFRRRKNHKANRPEIIPESKIIKQMRTCLRCGKKFYPTEKNQRRCGECKIENKSVSFIISKEDLEKECEKWTTLADLANALNVSRPTVRKYLEKYNLLEEFKSKFDFRAIPVCQYDLNGNLIKEWPSISDAEQTLKLYKVGQCVSHKRHSTGGYIWKLKENA